MKGIRLTVITSLALWVLIAADGLDTHGEKPIEKEQSNDEINTLDFSTSCPAIDPVDTTVHISHEYDCTKFYVCLAGEKILKECPYMNAKNDRLHFNPELQVCDLPAKAGCRKGSKGTIDKSVTPASNDSSNEFDLLGQETCHSNVDGYFIAHECNCQLYYICKNNAMILQKCPSDLYFSKSHQDCVDKIYADCGKMTCYHGKRKQHECQCDKYYLCWNNGWIVQTCPDGLDFNSKTDTCDHPDVAECREPTTPPPPSSICGSCPSHIKDRDFWPHECDCRLFYECAHRKIVLHQCPWGHYYDDYQKTCDIATNVPGCKNGWSSCS